MELAESLLTVTADNVFLFVNNAAIFREYSDPQMKFNTPFSSPFREDNNPSFVIYEKGFFVDFATGEKGNAITFLMKLNKINFNQALILLVYDFNLSSRFNCFNSVAIPSKKAAYRNPKSSICLEGGSEIKVTTRAFNEKDYQYWSRYNLDQQDLAAANIAPISHFFINSKMFIADALSYAFAEKKDGTITIKVYQPLSPYLKWISNNNGSVWELWEQLPATGKDIVITSSRKDALCVIKNLNIPSTAFQSETVIPKQSVMEEIMARFENVYLMMDNDFNGKENWGQLAAQKLLLRFPTVKNIVIPETSECKDFSGLVARYGSRNSGDALKRLIKHLTLE